MKFAIILALSAAVLALAIIVSGPVNAYPAEEASATQVSAFK